MRVFFESGEQDYLRLVHPILQKLQFDPAGKSMVELGCGAGRMTRSFAQRFSLCLCCGHFSRNAVSRERVPAIRSQNIRWVLSNGETLSGIENASVDFVFSYLVLQHMPNKEVVFSSIGK